MIQPVKDYVAGGEAFMYPGAGDAKPPGSAKVLLLTVGGVCIVGQWRLVDVEAGYIIGWAPLPKRDREKEGKLT